VLRNEGIFLGPSAALNVVGAVKLARKLQAGSTVVTVLCDGGERYQVGVYPLATHYYQGLPVQCGPATGIRSENRRA
jgi:hypothetical protein